MSDEPQLRYPATPEGMKASEDDAAKAVRVFIEQYLAFPSAFDMEQAIAVMRDYQRWWMWGRHR